MPHPVIAEKERPEDLSKSILAARVPVYLARRRADVRAIHSALALDDFASIEGIGHNLKGTGSCYGFPRITDIGALLESAARTASPGGIRKLLKDLDTYLQSLEDDVQMANDGPGAPHESAASVRKPPEFVCRSENKTAFRH